MANKFASGKIALGVCDRCGQQFALKSLRPETLKGKLLNNRVCTSCWDADHPQLKLGEVPVNDPQALRNPRPDAGLAASRELTGSWDETLDKLTRY
jgi:hypothetical protein